MRLRGSSLPHGVHVAILLAAGGLIFWLGAQAPNEDGMPPAYQSVLLLTGLPLLYAGFLTAADSLALREPAPRHAEVLIDAAGLAIAVIGAGGSLDPLAVNLTGGLPWYWEIVLLGAGFGLVAFGALDRRPGPAYLGVVNLILFIFAASVGTTLLWSPLILIAAGGFMIGAGLRPRRPLPPEPTPYRAGEAPRAARVRD